MLQRGKKTQVHKQEILSAAAMKNNYQRFNPSLEDHVVKISATILSLTRIASASFLTPEFP
jgi:hypothetical protein